MLHYTLILKPVVLILASTIIVNLNAKKDAIGKFYYTHFRGGVYCFHVCLPVLQSATFRVLCQYT